MRAPATNLLTGIVAVIRTHSAEDAMTLAMGLEDTPVDSIEVTMTVPDAVEVVRNLSGRLTKPVGVGTVTDAAAVEAVVAAGAAFIVSPGLSSGVVEAALAVGVPVVPGALSPSEIMAAWNSGATAVKVFPVSSLGGPEYIRMVRGPLPHIPLIVSGGISPGEVGAYLEAGAAAVSLGSSLVDSETVATGDPEAVRREVLFRLT